MRRARKPYLYELISIRYGLQPSSKETDISFETQLLISTHCLDKQQFSKFADDIKQGIDPEESLRQLSFAFTYDRGIAKALLKSNERLKQTTDIFACITSMLSMGWTCLPFEDRQTSDFEILIDLINRSSSTSLRKVINGIFERLLSIALPPETGIKWSQTAVQPVIVQFYANNTLDSSMYNLLIKFLRLVSCLDFSNSVRDSQLLLEQLISDNRQIVDVEDISALILYLQPFASKLDTTCFRILCRLTQKYSSRSLLDTFVLIPSAFIEQIAKSNLQTKLEFTNDILQLTETSIRSEAQLEILKCDDLIEGMLHPPYDLVDVQIPAFLFLPNKTSQIAYEIGEILAIASNEAKQTFVRAIIHLLVAMNDLTTIAATLSAFIILFRRVASRELLMDIMSLIVKCEIFKPNISIFTCELDPWVNVLRKAFIDLIIKVDGTLIHDFLEDISGNPLLFTEMLVRVMLVLDQISLSLFTTSTMFKYLITTSIQLRNINIKTRPLARSSHFSFLFELATNPETSFRCFNSPLFATGFLSFMFESDISNVIILCFRNALSRFPPSHDPKEMMISPSVDFVCQTIGVCRMYSDNAAYLRLAKELAGCINTALSEQPHLAFSFEPVLHKFLDFISSCPDPDILEAALKLQATAARSESLFEMAPQTSKKLAAAIYAVDKDEPSKSTTANLYTLLSGYGAMTEYQKFYIRVPSVVPLIIAAFGRSERLPDVLRYMSELAEYSMYNMRALHDGDLDFILMSFICQKKDIATIYYRNIPLTIKLSEAVLRDVVLPLLEQISLAKSSNAVATQMINFVAHNIDSRSVKYLDYLGKLLGKCSAAPKPSFSLITSRTTHFKINGLFGSDLNNGFSISLRLKADLTPIISSNASLTLFTITDIDEMLIRCYITNNKIFIKHEADGLRTSVHLVRTIPSLVWTLYTFVFTFKENTVRISTFQNNESLNDSDLCQFRFNNGELNIEVGGMDDPPDSDSWNDVQMGLFGDLRIYTGQLSAKDVTILLKRPWEFEKLPIFSTESLHHIGEHGVIPIKRAESHKKGRLFTEVTHELQIEMMDNEKPASSLLDNMIEGGHSNVLASFFEKVCTIPEYPQMIFNVLQIILKRSITAQKEFNMVNAIVMNIARQPSIINSELYRSIVDVFESIEYQPLRYEWFEKLVLNSWLWIKAPAGDFTAILIHWTHNLLSSANDIFVKFSYFTRILNQFKLQFCFLMDDDLPLNMSKMIPETKLNAESFFNDTYTVESTMYCRELFIILLKRIAAIHITINDCDALFNHLSCCHCKRTILDLMDITLDIIPYIKNVCPQIKASWLESVHIFIKQRDCDIVEKSIYIIHNLCLAQMNIHAQAICGEFNAELDKEEIFKRVLVNIQIYPNVFPLLCIMSLQIGGDTIRTLACTLQRVFALSYSMIMPNWYMWPVILTFHCKESDQEAAIFAIASLLILSKNRADEFEQILYYIILIENSTNMEENGISKQFIIAVTKLVSSDDVELIQRIYNGAFRISFFHLWPRLHNKVLLDFIEHSPFGPIPYIQTDHPIFLSQLKTITDLERLTFFDVRSAPISFQLRLDENIEWVDQDLADAISSMNKLRVMERPQDVVDYLMLMRNKLSIDPNKRFQMSATSLSFFEAHQAEYTQHFIFTTLQMLSSMRNITETSKMIIQHVSTLKLPKESAHMLQSEFERMLRLFLAVNQADYALTKDRTVCSSFCMMKKKRRTDKIHATPNPPPEYQMKYNGQLINDHIIRDVTMFVCRDRVILRGSNFSKSFLVQQITHLFARTRSSKDSCVEFYLSDGRSYLIDLISSDGIQLIKNLPRCTQYLKIMQTVKPLEMMQYLNYTQRWVNRELSTFDYLMRLNVISGRSFNSPDIQPIVPPILTSFQQLPAIADFTNAVVACKETTTESASGNEAPNARLFFDPDVPGPIPTWASDKYDFVYGLRCLLESNMCSQIIPTWIDVIWGRKMGRQPHSQLFTRPHPSRMVEKQISNRLLSQKIDTSHEAVSFVHIKSGSHSFKVTIVLANGTIATIGGTIGGELRCYAPSSTDNVDIAPKSVVNFGLAGGVLYTPETHTASILVDGTVISRLVLYSDTTLFAYAKEAFLFCPDNCTISYVADRVRDPRPKALCHSTARITALAASHRFKVFAYGTIDNFVSVHSLRNGRLVNRIDVGSEPEHIVITPKWGFVVIVTQSKIIVTTVNGEMLREAPLSTSVLSIYSFSYCGLDFIVTECSDHRLTYFEAFKPEKRAIIFESRDKVYAVSYDQTNKSFLIVAGPYIKIIPMKIF